MWQNRHCQIYWQILNPEKNVMRSTVLQVRGRKWPLLLGGKTLQLWCSADADRVMYNKCGQRTEAADAVRTAGTNFLSLLSLFHRLRVFFCSDGWRRNHIFRTTPLLLQYFNPELPLPFFKFQNPSLTSVQQTLTINIDLNPAGRILFFDGFGWI